MIPLARDLHPGWIRRLVEALDAHARTGLYVYGSAGGSCTFYWRVKADAWLPQCPWPGCFLLTAWPCDPGMAGGVARSGRAAGGAGARKRERRSRPTDQPPHRPSPSLPGTLKRDHARGTSSSSSPGPHRSTASPSARPPSAPPGLFRTAAPPPGLGPPSCSPPRLEPQPATPGRSRWWLHPRRSATCPATHHPSPATTELPPARHPTHGPTATRRPNSAVREIRQNCAQRCCPMRAPALTNASGQHHQNRRSIRRARVLSRLRLRGSRRWTTLVVSRATRAPGRVQAPPRVHHDGEALTPISCAVHHQRNLLGLPGTTNGPAIGGPAPSLRPRLPPPDSPGGG